MRFNVDIATAAMILAQVLDGGPMPQAAMAEGGKAKVGEPLLVGERGPEVIVPAQASMVIPQAPDLYRTGGRPHPRRAFQAVCLASWRMVAPPVTAELSKTYQRAAISRKLSAIAHPYQW
jgi:hypothetical protein